MDGAGRGLGDRAVERRSAPRLPDHTRRTCGIDRAKNGAHILRILNAVEDDYQWWTRFGANQIIDRGHRAIDDARDDALMNAMPRVAIEHVDGDPLDGNASTLRVAHESAQTFVLTARDPNFSNASRP